MEKLKYITPEMDVVIFDTEDIITTSGIDLPMDSLAE